MMRPAGLVIAGGASSRFGADKALALLGGRSLLAWSLDALGETCAQVAVSARPGGDVWAMTLSLGREPLADDPTHPNGPLAGLAAGLLWARDLGRSVLVTLPVDTPRVGADVIRRLAGSLNSAPAAFAMTSGGVHPLCAAWSVTLAAPLIARLDAGDHPSVQAWLKRIGAEPIAFENDAAFRNINTRADLAALEASLAGLPPADA